MVSGLGTCIHVVVHTVAFPGWVEIGTYVGLLPVGAAGTPCVVFAWP